MTTMSKILLDARVGAAGFGDIAADADLQLRFAAHVSADEATAWAKKRPQNGTLTALLDLPEAARLDVKAWVQALRPDIVDLRVPAWSANGMSAIGWPAGQEVLVRTLNALAIAGVAVRLVLHVSALTVGELTPERLAALANAANCGSLNVALRPVLGEDAPALVDVARATSMLVRSGEKVAASKLWPACALPDGIDGDPTFASERNSTNQDFTPECAGCEARGLGRCDGMVPDLLKASFKSGGKWQGWATWQDARTASVEIPEPNESTEAIELRLGLRSVWQAPVPPETADAFIAKLPPHLVVLADEDIAAEAASEFDVESEYRNQRLLYIATTLADAKEAAAAHVATFDVDEDIANAAHRRLGELLGYPKCCTDSYIAALPARLADDFQGVGSLAFAALQAARDSQTFDNRLDFASPLADACLLVYRPCRFDCTASLERSAVIEAEIARAAPGRLGSLKTARVNAGLLFADGTELPLVGRLRADGGIDAPRPHGLDDASDGPRTRAREVWAVIGAKVGAGAGLIADQPFDGAGGVSIVAADGSRAALETPDIAQHAEFPRLIVFRA